MQAAGPSTEVISQSDEPWKSLPGPGRRRYIHINALGAHLVPTLEELEQFPRTGHSALLGRIGRPWQAQQSVLTPFGRHVQPGSKRRGCDDLQRCDPPESTQSLSVPGLRLRRRT